MMKSGGRSAALLAALTLAGCSWVPDAVNPVAWYRDVTGASKNDALDKGSQNQKNLEAGGKEPYPNLASVPAEPGNATSQIDRDALQKSLVADRTNAQYSDEQLRAGLPAPIAPAPPAAFAMPAAAAAAPPAAPAAAQQQAAAMPSESPLVSPAIPAVPQGEAPAAPPPPPNLGPAQAHETLSAPERTAALPAGRRRAVGASEPVASIAFAGGSAALSDQELKRLAEVAAMQHAQGGALRVIGHAAEAGEEAQQKLQSFTLALTRAKQVAQALSSEGVPQQAIAVEAAPSAAGDAAAATAEIFLER